MHIIKDRLKKPRLWDSIVEYELKALWKYGVERISNKALRESIIHFLEHEAPDGFFLNPASVSGKHHPEWQNRRCGILRNTTECCVLADRFIGTKRELCSAMDGVLPEARDVVLAATILSDTFKYGAATVEPSCRGVKSVLEHGEIAADIWFKNAGMVPSDMAREVFAATKWHLGRFTPGWTPEIGKKFSPCIEVVHLLDAVFADKGLEVLYRPKSILE